MVDLRCSLAGIVSPNPFWLASAPPTDKAYNVERAFEAGWGGVVWKTLGEDPPVVNVSSRYGAVSYKGVRMSGFNNIELISDRPLDVNLDEITRVKRRWPDRAMIVSLMVPCQEQSWKAILPRIEDTGCDGIELNFGCPHGMSERQMGSAVGQIPDLVEAVTRWCKHYTQLPVIVKLTPNITDILAPAAAANRGGADAVSLINTFQSIVGVDLDLMSPKPVVDGRGTHGGYCGPAVKPIALRMVADIARAFPDLPISGIGGIADWRDAAEFVSLGATSVQVCTAAMHYGFAIVEDMIDGLSNWMADKNYSAVTDFRRRAVPNYVRWEDLNLNFRTVALIDQDLCIGCGLCHIGCEDTSHQAIRATRLGNRNRYEVIDAECVGCNLCHLACPVEGCISMLPQPSSGPPLSWSDHPSNPRREGTSHE
jgi:dihydropyrimidine dehydrogenase (NAD+) subunit PreA